MRTIIGEKKPNDRYDVRSTNCRPTDAHVSYGKLSNGTSGGASNLLAQEDQSSFEEAHHWNIQAKFYSVKDPHIVICMYDDIYGVQGYKMKYECGSLKRNSSVPPSLFFIFYFFYFFGGLHGSFYLTLICPLWDLFLTLGAILYILQEYRRSFTLYKGTHKKKM